MATASQSAFCPRCGNELPAVRAAACGVCNTPLTPPKNNFFGSPDYIWYQREMHLDNLDTSRPTSKTKTHDLKKIEEMELALTDWVRMCPVEDKVAAMRDAQVILSNAVHAPLEVRDIQKLISIGKAIGKLSESLETYFRSGGQIYDRKIGRVQTWVENDGGGDQATR